MQKYAARLAVAARRAYAAGEQCPIEMYDAAWEDKWGRLPHEPGYGVAPDGVAPVAPAAPDLIPEWVLEDARAFAAQGMTLRKVARIILPATECSDVPSCEQILTARISRAH